MNLGGILSNKSLWVGLPVLLDSGSILMVVSDNLSWLCSTPL